MATSTSLVTRVRLELADLGKSFVTSFTADGTTNRFNLPYSPVSGPSLIVSKDGVDISSFASVEETTGVLVLNAIPNAGAALIVSGTYYRYFTDSELATLVDTAVQQHTARHTDSLGRKITVANLPTLEEYPVALYATTLALYTLATDAAFDIDIQAPDGVTIPRSERYRQLTQMMATRQEQYRDLCVQLGIGMYSIDVFTLRRISKATNRYVPVYKPQEVDDRSYPQRAYMPIPTYGDSPVTWPTEAGDLTAYQTLAFSGKVTFSGDFNTTTPITAISASGSHVTYTAFNGYAVGDVITVSGVTPSQFNVTNAVITASGQTSFTIASTASGTYVSGGVVVRSAAITNASGSGSFITYTCTNKFAPNEIVNIAGITPDVYNLQGATITSATSTTFTTQGSASGSYVSGGTAATTPKSFVARLLWQRGSLQVVQTFLLAVQDNLDGTLTATMDLTADQTLRLAQRTYWQIATVDNTTGAIVEVAGGNFLVERSSTYLVI